MIPEILLTNITLDAAEWRWRALAAEECAEALRADLSVAHGDIDDLSRWGNDAADQLNRRRHLITLILDGCTCGAALTIVTAERC